AAQQAASNAGGGGAPEVESDFTNQSITLCDGGSITITWTITDLCETTTVDAIYTVTPAADVTYSEPADATVAACEFTDQAALDAAISAWVAAQQAAINAGGGCAREEENTSENQRSEKCECRSIPNKNKNSDMRKR